MLEAQIQAAKDRLELDDHLRRCTVRIRIQDRRGTGFFVAPYKVITCAHVIGVTTVAGQEVLIDWNGKEHRGLLSKLFPEPCPQVDIYPDIEIRLFLGCVMRTSSCTAIQNPMQP
jgi:hypothetical protein